MKRTRGARRRAIAALLVAATLVCLVATVTAGYLTRLSLIEATWWVTHTGEVKLAIAECERALDHGDVDALASAVLLTERSSRAALRGDAGRRRPLEDIVRGSAVTSSSRCCRTSRPRRGSPCSIGWARPSGRTARSHGPFGFR